MKRLMFLVIGFLLPVSLCAVSGVSQSQVAQNEQNDVKVTYFGKAKNIVKSVVASGAFCYTATMGGLVAHELGHALAAKMVGLKDVVIHIGHPVRCPRVYFSLFDKFFVRALSPFYGGVTNILGMWLRPWYQKVFVFAAGPAAETALIVALCRSTKLNRNYKKFLLICLINSLSVNLNPYIYGTDGYQIMDILRYG